MRPGRALRLQEGERVLVVNPHGIEAGARHALRSTRAEAVIHVVTIGPGDLFFRHGAEAGLRAHDDSASVATWDAAEASMLRDDARALPAARGLSRVLGRHVPDWTQAEPSARARSVLRPASLPALSAAPWGLRHVLRVAQGFAPPGLPITSPAFVAAPG